MAGEGLREEAKGGAWALGSREVGELGEQRLGGMKIHAMFGVVLLEQTVPGIWVQWERGESQIARALHCQAKKCGHDPGSQRWLSGVFQQGKDVIVWWRLLEWVWCVGETGEGPPGWQGSLLGGS